MKMRVVGCGILVVVCVIVAPWLQAIPAFLMAMRAYQSVQANVLECRPASRYVDPSLLSGCKRLRFWLPYELEGRWHELGELDLPAAYGRYVFVRIKEGYPVISGYDDVGCSFIFVLGAHMVRNLQQSPDGRVRIIGS